MSSIAPIAVIKVGGDVLLAEAERAGLANNIKDLIDANWQVIVLHGGGPQTDRLQQLHGLTPTKVGGRRITKTEDLLVIKQAICGQANVELTQLLQDAGINAFGCNGLSGKLIEATHRPPRIISGAGSEPIDLGEVGDVVNINKDLLFTLTDAGLVPVIATLGVEASSGRIFNINADTTVVKIAESLKANLLLLTTAVGAIYEDLNQTASRIVKIDISQARRLIKNGVIQGGMIPKVEEAFSIKSVSKVAIVGAKESGAFLSIANNELEFGTTFVTSPAS